MLLRGRGVLYGPGPPAPGTKTAPGSPGPSGAVGGRGQPTYTPARSPKASNENAGKVDGIKRFADDVIAKW